MKFIHLSDLHVKNDEGERENRGLAILSRSLLERYPEEEKPLVVITGDLVDNGQSDEYRQARRLLSSLREKGFELLVCPGNHDYGKGGVHYRDASGALFFEQIERGVLGNVGGAGDMASLYPKVSAYPEEKAVFFGIDSIAGKMDNIANLHLFANGKIGALQRKRLRESLTEDRYRDYTKIVYLHNHPWELIPGHGLDDGLQFIKEIDEVADVLCFGHMHGSHFWESRDGMMAMNAGKITEPVRYRGASYLTFREIALNQGETSASVIRVPVHF